MCVSEYDTQFPCNRTKWLMVFVPRCLLLFDFSTKSIFFSSTLSSAKFVDINFFRPGYDVLRPPSIDEKLSLSRLLMYISKLWTLNYVLSRRSVISFFFYYYACSAHINIYIVDSDTSAGHFHPRPKTTLAAAIDNHRDI